MNKTLFIVFIFVAFASQAIFGGGNSEVIPANGAEPPGARGLGLGIVLGEPTGFNAKLFISPPAAFDVGVAWSFVDAPDAGPDFIVYGDYLFHFFGLVSIPYGQLGFYCGIGGLLNIRNDDVRDDDLLLSLRIPLGVTYVLKSVPLDIFLEIVPSMEIFPATEFHGYGGLGVRYWFRW